MTFSSQASVNCSCPRRFLDSVEFAGKLEVLAVSFWKWSKTCGKKTSDEDQKKEYAAI
jgi:hypothetical protein